MDKVYFTGGIDMVNNKVFGICRILQEKINELVEFADGLQKLVERQEIVK